MKLYRQVTRKSPPRGKKNIKVHCARSIGKFLKSPSVQQAIRVFNLTHLNRGRNAY